MYLCNMPLINVWIVIIKLSFYVQVAFKLYAEPKWAINSQWLVMVFLTLIWPAIKKNIKETATS